MNEHSIPPAHLLEEGARIQIEEAEARYRRGLTDAFTDDVRPWWVVRVYADEMSEGEV